MSVEEEHLDILQNIESSVTSVYREHPQLTDFDVERVYDALIREYSRPEGSESAPPEFPTEERAALYAQAKIVCDFRLGDPDSPLQLPTGLEPVSREVIVACLKRLRRSVNKWTKRGGRRGYLDFIQDYT